MHLLSAGRNQVHAIQVAAPAGLRSWKVLSRDFPLLEEFLGAHADGLLDISPKMVLLSAEEIQKRPLSTQSPKQDGLRKEAF